MPGPGEGFEEAQEECYEGTGGGLLGGHPRGQHSNALRGFDNFVFSNGQNRQGWEGGKAREN